MKKIITLISLFTFSSLNAFTLNNDNEITFSENEVRINIASGFCNNLSTSDQELMTILELAVNQYWNKVPTSRLKLRAGSLVSVPTDYRTGTICNPSTSCEPNPALAVDADILISCNTNASNFSSNAILAVTVPNNISGNRILGSLILINDQATNNFKNKTQKEKVSIIAHELGHAFGLGHSPVTDSLMYYATMAKRSKLGIDDMDGISYLYPKEQPISCGSVIDISKNNYQNLLLNLIFGFVIVFTLKRIYELYLKLRPRFSHSRS